MNNNLKQQCRFCGLLVILVFLAIGTNSAAGQASQRPDSLKQLLQSVVHDSSRVAIYLRLSVEYQLSDYKASLQYAQRAIELAEKIDDRSYLSSALRQAGTVCQRIGLTGQATTFYLRYLDIIKDTGDDKALGYGYFNLCAVRLILEDYEDAEKYIHKAHKHLQAYAASKRQPMAANEVLSIYNNMGLIYSGKKDTIRAAEAFSKGITHYREAGGPPMTASQLLYNYGNILQKQQQFAAALALFEEAVALEHSINHAVGVATGLMYQGNTYMEMKDFAMAEKLLQQANQLVSSQDAFSFKKYISEALYELYKTTQQADSALLYLDLTNRYTEQLKLDEARDQLLRQELGEVFDQKVDQLQQTSLSRQRMYKRLLVLVVVAAGILLMLYLYARRKSSTMLLEQQLLKSAASKIEMEKSQLQNEVESKDKELVTKSIKEMQQNALIADIIQQISAEQQKRNPDGEKRLDNIVSNLNVASIDQLWNEFEVRFQQVDVDFYKRLQQKFPTLTPNERKLCAFLRLNLSSKDISSITGQSNHSVLVARTRLRKKLGLTNTDMGLVEFMALI